MECGTPIRNICQVKENTATVKRTLVVADPTACLKQRVETVATYSGLHEKPCTEIKSYSTYFEVVCKSILRFYLF